jgi:hypothetical protein
MKWPNKKIAGVIYRLDHLHPFMITVTPKQPGAPTYRVRASFGFHTFTKELDGRETPDLVFVNGRERRCFCRVRHGLSCHLPGIIRAVATGKVCFGKYGNYFISANVPGMTEPYGVFLNVTKADSADYDVLLMVVSAHERPHFPKRPGQITFATLIGKTARGESITWIGPKK